MPQVRERDGLFPIPLGGKHDADKRFVLIAKPGTTEQNDPAKKQHARTGHTNPDRYTSLLKTSDDVLFFERSILDKIHFVPCLIARSRKTPFRDSSFKGLRPLHLVDPDIFGPVAPSLAGKPLTVSFLDDFTAKSDVFLISSKSALPKLLEYCKARSENALRRIGFTMQNI